MGAALREPDEFAGGHIPDAIDLPLSQMRDRYAELPANRDIWTHCGVGQRAYFATRFLAQHGYRSWNLSGGYTTYQTFSAVGRTPCRWDPRARRRPLSTATACDLAGLSHDVQGARSRPVPATR